MSFGDIYFCSLDEESETLLKDSDTQESSAGGHCSLLSTDICGTMFRSRHDHDKTAQAGHNKDVSIPLVRDREVDEAAAIKVITCLGLHFFGSKQ